MKLSDLDKIFDMIGMSYDSRTHHLFLVNVSPWFAIWTVFNYVSFAYWFGPAFMKNRQPYNLRNVMLFYNVTMALFNAYAVVAVIPASNYLRELLVTEYPDRTDISDRSIYLIHMG